MKQNWSGLSKKSPKERLEKLKEYGLVPKTDWQTLAQNTGLPLCVADEMVENVLATFSLPYSLAPDFLVDGKEYVLPMVTEEPSVVAAASFAAKIIKRSGGFKTQVHSREMVGQIVLYDVPDHKKASERILQKKERLLTLADQAYPSIVKRGGGSRDLWLEKKGDFLICYLCIDPKEAMGANMLNTMSEALKEPLEDLSKGKSLLAILSNYATKSLVSATCQIDYRHLSREKEQADHIAQKIALASQLAQVDPYRAATHNKGIFNGIDALVMATGNDWRAIEAAGHAYASQTGVYKGLSTWTADPVQRVLQGQLTLPMPIATKGGSIGLNPTVQVSHHLLGNPSATELSSLVLSLGLAQNFAAIKALVTTGIQKGHMKLQAKSLALLAGANKEEVPQVVSRLLKHQPFNQETAQEIVKQIRKEKS